MRLRQSLCTVVAIHYGYCGPTYGQPGELRREGASLTVAQTNGSPVLALSATFQGVRSAPTDTVGDAADGRRSMQKTSASTHMRVPHAVFCDGRTQHYPLSAPIAKNRMGKASMCVPRDVGVSK